MKEPRCICGAKAEKIKTDLELFDGSVVLKEVDAYYCPDCEEEVLTTEQLSLIRDLIVDVCG